MEHTTSKWPVYLGLVLAVAGIFAPIAWDLIKAKSDLLLTYEGETKLVSKGDGLKKLKMQYDGRELSSISAMHFSLANKGKRPITYTDLVAPPVIALTGQVEILDLTIESLFPKNLVIQLEKSSPNSVKVTFPLLNPGDNVIFSILVADSQQLDFTASARIVGLEEMRLEQNRVEPTRTNAGWRWSRIVVAVFSCFSLLISFVGFSHIPKELGCKRKIQSNAPLVLAGATKEEVLATAIHMLSWTTDKERRALVEHIGKWPDKYVVQPDDIKELNSLFIISASAATSNVGLSCAFFFISLIGGWYAFFAW